MDTDSKRPGQLSGIGATALGVAAVRAGAGFFALIANQVAARIP